MTSVVHSSGEVGRFRLPTHGLNVTFIRSDGFGGPFKQVGVGDAQPLQRSIQAGRVDSRGGRPPVTFVAENAPTGPAD